MLTPDQEKALKLFNLEKVEYTKNQWATILCAQECVSSIMEQSRQTIHEMLTVDRLVALDCDHDWTLPPSPSPHSMLNAGILWRVCAKCGLEQTQIDDDLPWRYKSPGRGERAAHAGEIRYAKETQEIANRGD